MNSPSLGGENNRGEGWREAWERNLLGLGVPGGHEEQEEQEERSKQAEEEEEVEEEEEAVQLRTICSTG